jgi:hypothetical protein
MVFPDAGHGPYRLVRALCGRAVTAFAASLRDPESTQRARLAVIARDAAPTAFGREHGLAPAMDAAAWRSAVPVRTHAALVPWLDRVEAGETGVLTTASTRSMVETSGTTGRPKRLPVTDAWAASVADAQRLWTLALLRDDEGLAAGKALSIVSPAVRAHTAGGLPVGSNTGRMFLAQPFWVRWRHAVPYSAFEVADPDTRAYAILRHALAADVRSWTTANPTTLTLYLRHLSTWWEELRRDLADGTLGRLGLRRLPRRELSESPALPWALRRVNCWTGGPAQFFVDRLPSELRGLVREVGVTASEGFFAVPVDDGDPVAWLPGHLLEFMDASGEARFAWEVEVGRSYRLVVSTEAGLYRYDIGDIVEITGFLERVPRMRFVGRAGAELNACGEKLTEQQVLKAAAELGASRVSACVHVAEVPRLRLAWDGAGDVDGALRALNMEYEARRATGRMASPELVPLTEAQLARWRAAKLAQGAPEAQLKEPVILSESAWEALVR